MYGFHTHRSWIFQRGEGHSQNSDQKATTGGELIKPLWDLLNNLSAQFVELEELGHFTVDVVAYRWAKLILAAQKLEHMKL